MQKKEKQEDYNRNVCAHINVDTEPKHKIFLCKIYVSSITSSSGSLCVCHSMTYFLCLSDDKYFLDLKYHKDTFNPFLFKKKIKKRERDGRLLFMPQ